MKILHAYGNGIGDVARNGKMWLLFYLVQFLFALVLVTPVRTTLQRMIGHSVIGEEILRGNGANVLFEFITNHADVVSLVQALILLAGLIFLIVSIFLKAGATGCFVLRRPFSQGGFFRYGAEYFWRFLRLFLISLIFMAVAFIIYTGLNGFLKSLAGDSEKARVISAVASIGVLIFLLFFIHMVFDYARIFTVAREKRKMLKISLKAWGFVLRHPLKTLGLFYMVFLTGALFWGVYYFVGGKLSALAGLGILIIFIWQQLYAFTRVGINLLFISSQADLAASMKKE